MMTPDKVLETLQQNLRIGLGAAKSLVEALPDPEKRDRFIASLQSGQLDQNMQEWAQKGELTENEARRFIEEALAQVTGSKMSGSTDASGASSSAPVQIQIDDEGDDPAATTATEFAAKTEADYQAEIKALTAQIEALKVELAAEREGGSGSGNIEIG